MQRVKLPTLLKAQPEHVRAHVRSGKPVAAHIRTGKPKQARKTPKMRLKATMPQMQELGRIIQKNIAYLVYMGKEIARVHGLDVRFIDGQPVGDVADLISEGKQGMLIGGMEAIRSKKTGDLKFMQMKTRAKQRMRLMAKKLRGSGVQLPRDMIRQLAIISSATEKYMKLNNGEKPSREDLADMVILHKRTRDGEYVELSPEEKLVRIEALEGYKGAQLTDDMDTTPHIEEEDVAFWSKWTIEERELRETTHRVITSLVKEKALTPDERDVLYLRFYVDKPESSRGMNPRSFETVAKLLDQKRGIRKIKVRKTVGDFHRFKPMKKVRKDVTRVVRGKDQRGRRTVKKKRYTTYVNERYKHPIRAEIVNVTGKSFIVERGGQKWRIIGTPPFKEKATGQMDVYRTYQAGVEKILEHASAPENLKRALALVQKSIRVIIPIRL